MPFGDLALRAYVFLTRPMRMGMRARFASRHQSPVTGLFLHRVADQTINPWTMTVAQFDAMLGWLQANVDLVSIDEAQRRIQNGHQGRMTVHLSFDDGYADNCVHAIPELLARKIPFTYFVTTHNVRTGKPFAHDLQRGEPLSPNSIDQIQALADAGVEIGAHTRTHLDFAKHTPLNEIEYEVRGCRDDLADWIGYEPQHFAFPFGRHEQLNARVIQYIHDHQFKSYSSAYGGYCYPLRNNAFHLKRFHGDPRLARVQNWLSLDPRWVYTSHDYEYVPFQPKHADTNPSATPNSPHLS